MMQVTQAEGCYGDHTDYIGRVTGWCLYVLCRCSSRMVLIRVMYVEWQDVAYMCYVGRVAGWCIYVLCRQSGRMVLICVT